MDTPTHPLPPQGDDGTTYDQAILRWRAAPSKAHYDSMMEEQRNYYSSLRGYTYLGEETEGVHA